MTDTADLPGRLERAAKSGGCCLLVAVVVCDADFLTGERRDGTGIPRALASRPAPVWRPGLGRWGLAAWPNPAPPI